MEEIQSFIEFKNNQPKQIRGGTEMFDVEGHYKFMPLKELFDYWYSNRISCDKLKKRKYWKI